ncbi:lamin tail domain-containing protein [Candidatus Bipolaricaulota sp. J31]
MRISSLALVVLCAFHAASFGQVVIYEVGWAGTLASAYDEWIELHNTSDMPVDLAGWVLVIGEREIPLSGTIPPWGFFLLERTDDTTISDVTADLIYKGAMPNGGTVLLLHDPDGEVVDSANLGMVGGWFAGDVDRRASMERISPELPDAPIAWRTAAEAKAVDAEGNPILGTPGEENTARGIAVPVTVSIPGAILTGTVEISWETEGNVEALQTKIFVLPAEGTWTLVAEGLPPVGTYKLDTTSYPNGAVLIALGAFDELGPRGGAVIRGEITN